MALRFKVESTVAKREDILASSAELHRIADELPADIRNLEAISTAIDDLDACTHAIESFGMSAVSVMNARHQFDNIVCKFDKATTSAQAIEGFMDRAKELGAQFIEWIKKVIDKIKVWLSIMVKQIKHRLFDEKLASTVAKLKKAGITDEQLKECTSGGLEGNGVAGKSIIKAVCDICNSLHSVNPYISQVITCKDMTSLNTALGKLYYDTATPLENFNNRFFVTTDMAEKPVDGDNIDHVSGHSFITSDPSSGFNGKAREHFFGDADRNDKEGISFQEVAALEHAIDVCCNAFVAFSSNAEVYLKRFGSNVEKIVSDGNVAPDQKQLAVAVVKGLRGVTAHNSDLLGLICDRIIGTILDDIEKKTLESKPTEDKEAATNNIQPTSIRIKSDLDALVKKGDVAKARAYVISLIDSNDTLPWILRAGDFLNKNIDGGIYDSESGINMDWDIDYLKGVLKRQFRRGVLQRILQLFSKNGGQTSATKTSESGLTDDDRQTIASHDRSRVVGHILYHITKLFDREITDFDLPLRFYDAASKEFAAAGIQLDRIDDGWDDWANEKISKDPSKWTEDDYYTVKTWLRNSVCRKAIELAVKIVKKLVGPDGTQPFTVEQTIKKDIRELIQAQDKMGVRAYIIAMCNPKDKEKHPYITEMAIMANKGIKGGIFSEDIELDPNADVRTLRGSLYEDFCFNTLKRIETLLREADKKGTN